MSEQCYLHPNRTRKNFPEHEYQETDLGRFACRYCHMPRGDMTCYCAVYVAGEVAKHTVSQHDIDSCGGVGSYNGPCGGCWECMSQQLLYGASEYYTKWLADEETRLYQEEVAKA